LFGVFPIARVFPDADEGFLRHVFGSACAAQNAGGQADSTTEVALHKVAKRALIPCCNPLHELGIVIGLIHIVGYIKGLLHPFIREGLA
jgi:hypothetical protein